MDTEAPAPVEPAPGETTRRRLALSVLADIVIATVVGWLAIRSVWPCVESVMVAGDAFGPIECGWRMLQTGELTRPAQPIYGYGVCLEYGLLTHLADDLRGLARWTTSTRTLVAPLLYLSARVLAPKLGGTSVAAARVGGIAAAAVVARHPGIVLATEGGTHGYLAMVWIAVAVLCLAMATTRRAPVALAVAAIAIPMAVMNHPNAVFVAALGLALVPALVHSTGWLGVLAALLPGLVVSWPRIGPLRRALGSADSRETLVASPMEFSDLVQETLGALDRTPNYLLAVGGLVLLGLAVRAPREADRWVARSWGAAVLAVTLAIVGMAMAIGYVRSYHVELATPVFGVGLATGVALLVDLVARTKKWPWSAFVLAPALGFGAAAASGSPHTASDPICRPRESADTVAGSSRIERAIRTDLADLPPTTRVMTNNLDLGGESRPDNVLPATLGLLLSGMDPARMECCPFGEEAAWYWVLADHGDPASLDRIVALDGVDQLLGPPQLDERLIVARTPAGRYRLREEVCSRHHRAWTGHFTTWLSLLSEGFERDFPVPLNPLDCRLMDVRPLSDEPSESDGVRALVAQLAESPDFEWTRSPVRPWGPSLLHFSSCADPQLPDTVAWLDSLDGRAAFEGWAIASIIVDPGGGAPPCGVEQGGSRGIGRTSEVPGLADGEREVRAYDHRGRLRRTWSGAITAGDDASREIEEMMSLLHGEHLAAAGARDADPEDSGEE